MSSSIAKVLCPKLCRGVPPWAPLFCATRGAHGGTHLQFRQIRTLLAKASPVFVWIVLVICLTSGSVSAQKPEGKSPEKSAQKKERVKAPSKAVTELAKLREEFLNATKSYKLNLEKLLARYENNVKIAEDKLELSKKLFSEGLISKSQIDEYERAVSVDRDKVTETRRQLDNADAQIADTLVEANADNQMAKTLRMPKGSFIRTASLIRYNGAASWVLADAWKVQRFFSDTFKKPLPVGVFGQGSIHDRWHLDHRNAMDVSLNPDGVEGQALMNFLRNNGIPFSAFREAIPGTATGPHIHVGRPSHRY